jgi:uncharacterized integral membrane protein
MNRSATGLSVRFFNVTIVLFVLVFVVLAQIVKPVEPSILNSFAHAPRALVLVSQAAQGCDNGSIRQYRRE